MDRPRRPDARSLRISLIKWELAVIVLVIGVVLVAGGISRGRASSGVAVILVYGSLLVLTVVLAFFWHLHWRRLHSLLLEAEEDLEQARQRMTAAFQLSHQFAQANDEGEIIRVVLRTSRDLLRADGASFVPLNERGRPYPAVTTGDLPQEVLRDWAEHLADPAVRQSCASCRGEPGKPALDCPLFDGPFRDLAMVHCLPARRGDRDLGVLNLYLDPRRTISVEERTFLQAMLDEMALAMEAVRLRDRELNALRKVRRLENGGRSRPLAGLLDGLSRTLGADFVLLDGPPARSGAARTLSARGDIDRSGMNALLEGLEFGTMGNEPRVVNPSRLHRDMPVGLHSLIVFPIERPGVGLQGRVIFGKYGPPAFDPTLIALLSGMTEVLDLTLQLDSLTGELAYQATIAERSRLAREIHDGLAQTLGFLKLTVAQIENHVEQGEVGKIKPALRACHLSLREAFTDARQAIDDLRITPELGWLGWVRRAAAELEESDGIRVQTEGLDTCGGLPAEVEVQLVRIVQEALTNVRKHASASRIWIRHRGDAGVWLLDIQDNGRGFDPRDFFGVSRHGLAGMQERAELIGANLEVQSEPGEGTLVRLRLPAPMLEASR